jgi:hypothetical protein
MIAQRKSSAPRVVARITANARRKSAPSAQTFLLANKKTIGGVRRAVHGVRVGDVQQWRRNLHQIEAQMAQSVSRLPQSAASR